MWFPLSLLILGAAALPQYPQDFRIAGNSNAPSNITLPNDPATDINPIAKRHCGTGPPTEHLLRTHHELHLDDLRKRASRPSAKYVVNTYFHIVATKDQAKAVTPAMVANQFGALQAAYASSSISFRLLNTTRTVNDSWATDANDADMKAALRRGNYSTLNIYFQTNLSSWTAGQASQLLGYCTLPTNVTYKPCANCAAKTYPSAVYSMDGCNVLAGTMPKGSLPGYNMGKTAVHEVGHWFGLLHTFQGNSCAKNAPGDFIDDTPQQSTSTNDCPQKKDSCPGSPGTDLIHNYMDYSTDRCYEGFTPGQVNRMQSMFGSLRFSY